MSGQWNVRFEREFDTEFFQMSEDVKAELVAHAELLTEHGPSLGRPMADTLRGSAYPNMKELRFNADGGVWRVAFAFDHKSRGILLVAGNKVNLWGKAVDRFYNDLINTADTRFKAYTERVKEHERKQMQTEK